MLKDAGHEVCGSTHDNNTSGKTRHDSLLCSHCQFLLVNNLVDCSCAQADPMGDLTTELERQLGKLVAQKYNTDFFILHRYPLAVR